MNPDDTPTGRTDHMSTDETAINLTPCTSCAGEGITDNNADVTERAPWSFWASLTPPSDLAVRLGMVRRIPCETCNGSGAAR